MTLFDVGIFLGILFAMLLSSMPKKLAMLICLFVSITGLILNSAIEAGYFADSMIYPMAGVAEALAAVILMLIGIRTINHRDARFFYIMGWFLIVSSWLNSIYIPLFLYTDFLTFEFYTVGFHVVAMLHVFTMFVYSDGIGKAIRNIRGIILGHDPDYLGVRD